LKEKQKKYQKKLLEIPFNTEVKKSMSYRTPYQEKVIKRYYENRDDIMTNKLAMLITDLYLSEGKKRQQIWKRIAAALTNLKVPQSQIDHLISQDNPALLAKYIDKK
jgi:hypothetical protein